MINLFVSTETYDPVSAIIRWWTDSAWSHTGFIREDGFTFSAQSDGLGVAWRPPNPQAKVLRLMADGIEGAFAVALTQQGNRYDFRNIAGIALAHDWQTPGKDMCAKLVFWSFQKIGKPLLNHRLTPLEKLNPGHVTLANVWEP